MKYKTLQTIGYGIIAVDIIAGLELFLHHTDDINSIGSYAIMGVILCIYEMTAYLKCQETDKKPYILGDCLCLYVLLGMCFIIFAPYTINIGLNAAIITMCSFYLGLYVVGILTLEHYETKKIK